jgi:hypothetical protein
MFDCPEKSRTSPKRISERTTTTGATFVLAASTGADTVMSRPTREACCEGRWTFQKPVDEDVVVALTLEGEDDKATEMSVFGVAVPQIGTGRSRWRTMCEPNTLETRSWIEAEGWRRRRRRRRKSVIVD